ncbi:uncharacterized protein LOC119464240 isoform X3 [Dermacentor silvarum]|uniref:uncharacterized protein LOC119464240 isoform X3 n=1 Tax=Dermacentor silvarum TaxID=543639 RepID=UPI00189AEEF3|nr:uncharacterized protein LOC119464240 isoform X3 [Dermacentor silvarum]
MFEARDLIIILREQYVDCPNQRNCKRKVQLQNLPDHYVLCKQRVQCPSCDQSIETKTWMDHRCAFNTQQAITEAAEKSSASEKTEEGHQEEQKTLVLRSHDPRTSKPSATQKYSDIESAANSNYPPEERRREESDAAAIQPRHQVMSAAGAALAPVQHSEGENGGPAMMQVCEFCQRNVKQSNMPRHRENCAKAPKLCVYCEKQFQPEDMLSHIQECPVNPDNVTPERETRRLLKIVTSQPTSHGGVAGKLCETSEPPFRDQLQTPNSRCKAAAAAAAAVPDPVDHSSAHSPLYFDHGTNVGGTPTWFQYLASKDWLSAFVAMEESFSTQRLEEHDRYARLAPALVTLNQYACVQDFLAQPSPVQTFDCLLAALFVRVYLPQNAWPRTQEVTWMQAQQYLPHFLASRLSEEAVDYLRAFPVFLEEIGSLPVDENWSRTTESQPGPNEKPVILEESTSTTTAKTLQGEKRAETETSERALRGEAAASDVLGKKYSAPLQDESSAKPCHLLADFGPYPMNTLHLSAPFQKDTEKLSVDPKSDDSARGEDADCTIYLNVPPTAHTETSQQSRSHSHPMANAHPLSNRELLYSAIEASSRHRRGLLSASSPSSLQPNPTYKIPPSVSSIRGSNQCTAALHGINSTMGIVTSSADSTASAGSSEYTSTEQPPRRTDSIESSFGGKAGRGVTCREFAAKLEERTSSECATFTEPEHSDDRSLHQLCTRGPPYKCRSATYVPKQYRDTELGTGSRAERSKPYPGRARLVSTELQAPAFDENSFTFIHSLGRGLLTSRNGTRRPWDCSGVTDQCAFNVDGVRNPNFEDAQDVQE